MRVLAIAAIAAGAVLVQQPCVASEAAARGEDIAFFENKIRPIFAEACLGCHGAEKQKANLRLDSRDGMLTGGDSGPVLVPGNPDESLLIEAVKYESFEMPPTGKLSEEKIALLREWIAKGAPAPEVEATRSKLRDSRSGPSEEERSFWSFQPRLRPSFPIVEIPAEAEGAIDVFVGAKRAAAGLRSSDRANDRELVRRLTYDLAGLPPELDTIEAFAGSKRPDRWSRMVDRLLASPRYGERWGRHWLDVVRFAQTNGYERDAEKPYAWRYRDYVIDAWNADKPYDQFVREQIAGDELDEVTDKTVIATGFVRLGVWDDEPDDSQNAEFEEFDDVVSTMGQAVLGLTIGCARCHDHKFDPISQEDYYGLVSFFRNVRRYEKHVGEEKDFSMLVKLSNGEPALAVREHGPTAPATHVLIRGDARSPGSEVEPKFPSVLCRAETDASPTLKSAGEGAASTGRRRVLADWLMSDSNPLPGRVVVNRLWRHHFGRGIVATPSDFGKTGDQPSHPELLDWLASELVEGEWQLKRMHRQMVESATYQQSSRATDEAGEQLDPENRLYWRQTMRRLEAEAIRDSVLSASGALNLEMGGRGFFPELSKEVLATQSIPGNGWDKSPSDQQSRRSVYIFVKRTLRPPLLETLDSATPDQSIAARPVTTIAPQALLLLNSQFMNTQSLLFADLVLGDSSDATERVRRLYRLALQRDPSEDELATMLAFLERQTLGWRELAPDGDGAVSAERQGFAELAKLILNLNEFVYVD